MSAMKPNRHNKVKGQEAAEAKKSSKKEQGEHARPHAMGRSLGSEFAHAVMNAKEQARNMKGSRVGFLGVEKKTIEAKELAGERVLYRGKKKSK